MKTTIAQRQVRQIARINDAYLIDLLRDGADSGAFGWYERASEDIAAFSSCVGAHPETVAAVTSIMSPRTSVHRCSLMAAEFFTTGERPHGLMTQRWDSVREYYRSGRIGSSTALKIQNFARALNGDFSATVCDTWIAASFKLDYGKDGLAPAPYAAIVDRIGKLAKRFGLSNCDTQAAIWVGKRIEVGEHREGDAVADKSLCQHLPDFVAI